MKKYDILICNLNPNHPTETGKTRPVVVISGLRTGAFVAVAPIGSNPDQEGFFRIGVGKEEGLDKVSWILVDQFRSVHRSRLKKIIGHLGKEKQKRLDEGIKLFLDLG